MRLDREWSPHSFHADVLLFCLVVSFESHVDPESLLLLQHVH